MITVTKTFLPPLEEYTEYLKTVWNSGQVTNNGQLLQELEKKLAEFLGVKHLYVVSNGTTGLQIALKVLDISGEVITTPFSYVATTGSILWENAVPVFADIDVDTCCIDPWEVEKKITDKTRAIVAVHVYGNACNVAALEQIAKKYGLRLIYDAAHAFACNYENKSLASFGDISVLSFHATKLFHMVEGGALVTDDDELAEKISLCRAFGHSGDNYYTAGINGKNTELHAAMGLCMLPRIGDIIAFRKEICRRYDSLLQTVPVKRPVINHDKLEYNYAYYPVIFPTASKTVEIQSSLNNNDIYTRRYFFPPLNRLPYYQGNSCPIAEDIASRVLCLPMSHVIDEQIQQAIVKIIRETLSS